MQTHTSARWRPWMYSTARGQCLFLYVQEKEKKQRGPGGFASTSQNRDQDYIRQWRERVEHGKVMDFSARQGG
jgi:hypothetical protein